MSPHVPMNLHAHTHTYTSHVLCSLRETSPHTHYTHWSSLPTSSFPRLQPRALKPEALGIRHQSILKHSRQFQCEAQVEIHPTMQRRGTKANPMCGPWVNSICIPRELVGPVQSQALSRLLNRLCCYVHWDLCAHSNFRN